MARGVGEKGDRDESFVAETVLLPRRSTSSRSAAAAEAAAAAYSRLVSRQATSRGPPSCTRFEQS